MGVLLCSFFLCGACAWREWKGLPGLTGRHNVNANKALSKAMIDDEWLDDW